MAIEESNVVREALPSIHKDHRQCGWVCVDAEYLENKR